MCVNDRKPGSIPDWTLQDKIPQIIGVIKQPRHAMKFACAYISVYLITPVMGKCSSAFTSDDGIRQFDLFCVLQL